MQLLAQLLGVLVAEAIVDGVVDVGINAHGTASTETLRSTRAGTARSREPAAGMLKLAWRDKKKHVGESYAHSLASRSRSALIRQPWTFDPVLWASQHVKANRTNDCDGGWKHGGGSGGNVPLIPIGYAMNYSHCQKQVQEKRPDANGCTVQEGGFGKCWAVLEGTETDNEAGMETCYFKYWRHPSGPWGLGFVPIDNWEPEAGRISVIQWPPNFCIDMTFSAPELNSPEPYRVIVLMGGEAGTSCGDFYVFIDDSNNVGMGVKCDSAQSDPPLMHPEGLSTYSRHDLRFCYDMEHWHARIWDNSFLRAEAVKRWNFPQSGLVSVFAGTHDETHWANSLVKMDRAELFSLEMFTNTTTTTTFTTTTEVNTTTEEYIEITLETSTSSTTSTTTRETTTTSTTTITRAYIFYHNNDDRVKNVTINITKIIRTVRKVTTEDIINTTSITKEAGINNGSWYLTQRACWAFPCGDGYVAMGEPYHCRGWNCTWADFDVCCRVRASCADYECGYGAAWKEHPENILCQSYKCDTRIDREKCCNIFASCALKFVCPEGYKMKSWAAWPPPACGDVHCDSERDVRHCCDEIPTTTTTLFLPPEVKKLVEKYKLQTNSTFFLRTSGKCASPALSVPDCSDAGWLMGLNDTTATDDGQIIGSRDDPPYCYIEGGELKYNGGWNTGSCSISKPCICVETTEEVEQQIKDKELNNMEHKSGSGTTFKLWLAVVLLASTVVVH